MVSFLCCLSHEDTGIIHTLLQTCFALSVTVSTTIRHFSCQIYLTLYAQVATPNSVAVELHGYSRQYQSEQSMLVTWFNRIIHSVKIYVQYIRPKGKRAGRLSVRFTRWTAVCSDGGVASVLHIVHALANQKIKYIFGIGIWLQYQIVEYFNLSYLFSEISPIIHRQHNMKPKEYHLRYSLKYEQCQNSNS